MFEQVKQTVTLGEVKKYLSDKEDAFTLRKHNVPAYKEEKAGKHFFEVAGVRVVIPKLGLSVRNGMFRFSENEEPYEDDPYFTLIYAMDEKDPAKYLYWEQDGFVVSVYNYLSGSDKEETVASLEEYECVIEFEIFRDMEPDAVEG